MSIFDDAATAGNGLASQVADQQVTIDGLSAQIADLEASLAAVAEATEPLPLLKGLTTTNAYDGYPWQPLIYWSDLQPTAFGELDLSAVNQALAKGVPVRLRLMAGRYSPVWVNSITGTVDLVDPNGVIRTLPRWWTPSARGAYRDMIGRLALALDGSVPAVSMSAGMTFFAEPCIRQLSDSRNRANLLAAGFSYQADLDSFADAMDAHRAFARTRTFMAFNPYQKLAADGTWTGDDSITASLMSQLRSVLPSSIVQNNSIRTPELGALYPAMYDAMTAPKSFQTAGASLIGDVAQTIQWAIDQGAHLVESYVGFDKGLTTEQIADFDARLKANA